MGTDLSYRPLIGAPIQHHRKHRPFVPPIFLLVFALLLGCGAKERSPFKAADSAVSSVDAFSSSPASSASSVVPATDSTSPSVDAGRKIIRNAQIELRVEDTDAAWARIEEAVQASGGRIQEVTITGTPTAGRRLTATIRVPSQGFAPVSALLLGLGIVSSQRQWTEDVTEQFVDFKTRITSQEIHLARLRSFYERGGSIEELVQLEREIARVTEGVEGLKGKLLVLSSQIDFSTLSVTMYEEGVPGPVHPPSSVAERIRNEFTGTIRSLVNFTGDLLVFSASAVPTVAYGVVVLGLPTFLLSRWSRWRKMREQSRAGSRTDQTP